MFKFVCLLGLFAHGALGQDTAALIIGGLTAGEDNQQVTDTIELFGCPFSGDDSLEVPHFPIGTYLTAGKYIDDGNNDLVAACGGFQCHGNDCPGLSDKCWTFNLETMNWVEHSTMTRPRYSSILNMLPNVHDTSDSNLYPVMAGQQAQTEIYRNSNWEVYTELQQMFYSLDCIVYNEEDGYYYMMLDDIRRIDPRTGNRETIYTNVPEQMRRPGKCSLLKKDGKMGIFTRFGFWFNLSTRLFEKVHEPPFHPWAHVPNAMWSFQGKPTIFGNPICDVNGDCQNKRVVQYDPDRDEWRELGQMSKSRVYHEVIEVPMSFCDAFAPIDYVPVTTQAPPATPIPPERDTAAIIVGGFSDTLHSPAITDVVELYGCDPSSMESEAIEPFPKQTYLNGGTMVPDSTGNYALFCGGYTCEDGTTCGLNQLCYKYPAAPDTYEWVEHSAMLRARYAHEIHMMPMANANATELYPVVFGYHLETEMYDKSAVQGEPGWKNYVPLENRIYSLDCIVYDDAAHKVYSIVNSVLEFNMDTGESSVIQPDVPEKLQRPGRCALVEIDGEMGIFTRYGFWFNINTRTWEAKHEPPFHPWSYLPNAMTSYQGRPTIFGNPICETDGTCYHQRIVQYDPETDQWYNLGTMIHARRFHTVVEVSKDACEFVPTMPPTTPAPQTTPTQQTTTTSAGVKVTGSFAVAALILMFNLV